MTTNGIALHRRLLSWLITVVSNIKLSHKPFSLELMTRRRGRHEAVLKTLYVALSSLASVTRKIKVVVVKGSEVFDFVDMTENEPISVRFIEFMSFHKFFLRFQTDNFN